MGRQWFLKAQYATGGGGGSGHIIVDDGGYALTQRSKMKFNGTYSEDNSTNEVTEVNITRTMTRSEFDLLSDDEKTGLINVIDETSGVDGKFQPIIYSEEEREIGVWTDGKPLYEKTFKIDNISIDTAHETELVDLTSLNIDTYACDVHSIAYLRSYNVIVDENRISIGYKPSTKKLIAGQSYTQQYTAADILTTIRYTKTTDTAGSGQWTPQGIPAIHYSEDEVVVGTWIDGSTLYARTFINENLSRNTINNYDVYTVGTFEINAKMAFFITGALYETNDQRYFTLPYERSYSSSQKVYQELYTDAEGKLYILASSVRESTSGYHFTKAYMTVYYTKLS